MGLAFVEWNPLTGAENLPLRYRPPGYSAPHEHLELNYQTSTVSSGRTMASIICPRSIVVSAQSTLLSHRLTMNSCHRPLLMDPSQVNIGVSKDALCASSFFPAPTTPYLDLTSG